MPVYFAYYAGIMLDAFGYLLRFKMYKILSLLWPILTGKIGIRR